MDEFEQYLLAKKLGTTTITSHCYNVKLFIQWLAKENYLDAADIGYNGLLAYIQQEKKKNVTPATINLRLTSITHYFEYLKKLGEVKQNPARLVRVKGTVKRVIENPLSTEELQMLCQHYSQLKKASQHQHNTDIAHHRNVVILGLLVYQGIHSGELQKMEVGHISLGAGTVYIPSTSRSNSRTLPLSPVQMLPVHEYVEVVRPRLKPKGEELFPGNLHNVMYQQYRSLCCTGYGYTTG
jgi:site-specific recombinase XerD